VYAATSESVGKKLFSTSTLEGSIAVLTTASTPFEKDKLSFVKSL
jgi:hypothetical protein